jgi:thiosulfate/3-mercaptopyruvate sulfurtransferase
MNALISVHALPVFLDVRWKLGGPPGLSSYLEGHIPGASFVDLDTELAGPPGTGGRHPMPSTETFQGAMRRAGVSAGRHVVVYDAGDSTAAARAWWLLRYFGHPDVQVLDGGFRAWTAAGRPVATGSPASGSPASGALGDFVAEPGHMPLLDASDATTLVRAGGVLLDARSAERYRGETEPVDAKAGHIPGAVSAPTTLNVRPDGTFADPAALAARFAAFEGRSVGVYCGSGVTAAHEVLALEMAGIPAALYLGSWSDWITDPTRPIATA